MNWEEYIYTDDCGERFVKGHRVPILSVLREHIEHGKDGRQLAERFHTLSQEKIYAVLAYYYANKDEVDQYLRATMDEIERQRQDYFATYSGPTNEELRARLRAKEMSLAVGPKS